MVSSTIHEKPSYGKGGINHKLGGEDKKTEGEREIFEVRKKKGDK